MDIKKIVHNETKVTGTNDVVNGNDLTIDTPAPSVLVEQQSDLANLPSDLYPAGTIAYTAGFRAMWQLSAAGEWVSMI